jgi:hypothetical protein
MSNLKTKQINKTQLDDFDEQLNTIKSKYIGRNPSSENKEADNEQIRRQKVLINPKLRGIMYMFDPELQKEDIKASKNIRPFSNTLLSGPRNNYINKLSRYNSEIIEYSSSLLNDTKSKSPVVKDRLKDLKFSLISERKESANESKHRYISIRSREMSPKDTVSRPDSITLSTGESRNTTTDNKYNRFNRFYSSPIFNYKQKVAEDWFYSPTPKLYSSNINLT